MKRKVWLAILLSLVMLVSMLSLTACGKKDKADEGEANNPEDVAEAFVEAWELEDYASMIDLYAYDFEAELKDDALDEFDSEEEFFEEMSAEFDEDVSSWKEVYKAFLKQSDEWLKEDYGDDYTLTVKATGTEEMDEETVGGVINYLLDKYEGYIDEDAVEDIEEAVEVTVEAVISGEEDETTDDLTVTVVKIDGKWKVANWYHTDDYDDYYAHYIDK